MANTIRVTLLEGNLTHDGSATREDVERLAQLTAAAIVEEYPGFTVEVPVMWKTNSAVPSPLVRCDDPEHEEAIAEEAREIADATWEEWIRALNGAEN